MKEIEEHKKSGPYKSALDAINSPTWSKAHKAIKDKQSENKKKVAQKMALSKSSFKTYKKEDYHSNGTPFSDEQWKSWYTRK